ncbi:MAG TPA: glycosyltransferase family 39 protein [Thermoanaerobaculia bacterium]|nr:glycosyltransferase family 39 protein [Thermoanaerobaculia bacterium]
MRFLPIWTLLVALALAAFLGSPPLLDADEGRNAEVAREMAATNDYVMPRLDGLPYLDKPIVYFAAEAAAMEILGPTELAARLPAYLFTLATAALIFFFAKRVMSADAAWIAVIAFLSMPLTIAFARTVIFDSALTFFITGATIAFYFAIESRERRWSVLAWAAIGLGVITKGPVAIVLPLFVAIPYAIKRKAFRALWSWWGLVAFIAIIAPWVWAVSQVVPEFLRYVLVTETAERMATKALKRTGPPWYFIPYLLGGALPWSLVAIFSWKEIRRRNTVVIFLVLWVTIPFLFFSISQSKRPQYILPLMVPVALLVARVWEDARTRVTAIILTILGAIFAVAPFLPAFRKMKPVLHDAAEQTAIGLAIAFLIGGIVALFAKRKEIAFAALTIPMIAIPIAANPLLHALGERRSTRSFVAQLAPRLTANTRIVGIEAFTGSLAFYLQRPIVVVTEDASELTSNYLMRRYEKFTSDPKSPLKPIAWLANDLDQNREPTIYIVRNDDAARRALLEARGMRKIAEGAHHVAYARI